jgi:hypothetical protein
LLLLLGMGATDKKRQRQPHHIRLHTGTPHSRKTSGEPHCHATPAGIRTSRAAVPCQPELLRHYLAACATARARCALPVPKGPSAQPAIRAARHSRWPPNPHPQRPRIDIGIPAIHEALPYRQADGRSPALPL